MCLPTEFTGSFLKKIALFYRCNHWLRKRARCILARNRLFCYPKGGQKDRAFRINHPGAAGY